MPAKADPAMLFIGLPCCRSLKAEMLTSCFFWKSEASLKPVVTSLRQVSGFIAKNESVVL